LNPPEAEKTPKLREASTATRRVIRAKQEETAKARNYENTKRTKKEFARYRENEEEIKPQVNTDKHRRSSRMKDASLLLALLG